MDISDIIRQIEDVEDNIDKVILYTDVLAHLQQLKVANFFKPTEFPWKDAINTRILMDVRHDVDKNIKDVMEYLELYIKEKPKL